MKQGQPIKLSWIAYLNSKFFTANSVQNIEKNELNCSSGKQISPNILAVYPLRLPSNLTDKNLITTIFEEQLVRYLFTVTFILFFFRYNDFNKDVNILNIYSL